MNSNDPHLASVKEFIGSSIEFREATESLKDLADELTNARDRLAGVLEENDLPDDFENLSSDEISERIAEQIKSLEDQIAELETVPNPDGSLPNKEGIAALQDEIDSLSNILESPEFEEFATAENTLSDAEDNVAELKESVSNEALREALSKMINDNRADAVDDEMVDWAKSVLDGKIEEIRDASEDEEGFAKPETAPEENASLDPGLLPDENDLRPTLAK
ncbi:hypothetical protein [Labrenzia sp. DG1229]|uniref:hypothetical protein n=1 Tax=Labrenzia sp. DG1229 TaxID=681847 RepID=UPI000A941CE1|nr:hypothetical protein [Labrenzia sp. DG1229]